MFCIIFVYVPATCSWITFTVWSMYTGPFLKSEKKINYVRISFWSDICKLQDILILSNIIYSPSFCENYILLFQSDTYAATTVFCAIILHLTQLVFDDVQKTYYVGKHCNRNQKSASFHQKICHNLFNDMVYFSWNFNGALILPAIGITWNCRMWSRTFIGL